MTLPNFIIVGATKAGTSSMFHYLKQHPDVYMPELKETRYFAFDPNNQEHHQRSRYAFPVRTLAEYEALFADVGGERAIGEASPTYMNSLVAPEQIKQTIPDAKLIFSLRHPIKRAYSAYQMAVRDGRESGTVHEAFAHNKNLVRTNFYSQILSRWFTYFDRSQVKVILFEDFIKNNSIDTMQEIYRFLGVDDSFAPNTEQQHNVGGIPKNRAMAGVFNWIKKSDLKMILRPYTPKALRELFTKARYLNHTKAPPMPADLFLELQDVFKDEVLKLQDLLGRDLSVWGFDQS